MIKPTVVSPDVWAGVARRFQYEADDSMWAVEAAFREQRRRPIRNPCGDECTCRRPHRYGIQQKAEAVRRPASCSKAAQ